MKLFRKLSLCAAALIALSLASPAQAESRHGGFFRGGRVFVSVGYPRYYRPVYYRRVVPAYYGYYNPYYGPSYYDDSYYDDAYYGPGPAYYGGGITFAFGGHSHYRGDYYRSGGYRGRGYGYRGRR